MAGNEEPRHSQSGFKTILRQKTFLFIQRLGNTLNHAANSSSSLQTAISIEDEEKDFRKDLKGSGCSSGQEIMQCYLLISLFVCVIMIVTGGTNIGNCPADNYLPVWMIIYGCTGVAVGFTVTCLGFPEQHDYIRFSQKYSILIMKEYSTVLNHCICYLS
ncbi:putative integral membrane protein [Brugia pahangi]